MAAAVLSQSVSNLALNGDIMPPSPVSQNFSRHGRSRHGGSISKANKARGRGYSVVDDREATITKALNFLLKRTIEAGNEQEEGEKKIVADSEGWTSCEEVLQHPNLSSLEVSFEEIQNLVTSRARFSLKLKASPPADDNPSFYLIRASSSPPTSQAPASLTNLNLTPLTPSSENLPSLVVYETSYANYPLVLASGGIKRAGGQAYLTFSPIHTTEAPTPSIDTDVSIYIDLSESMRKNDTISWQRGENGNIYTEGDTMGAVPMKLWKKAVGRRPDIGVLFEDGEVRKEVPMGLRGKGVKGKKGVMKGKGRGAKEMKARSEDEASASE